MWDDNISHSGWGLKKMFESIPFSKLNITEQRTNTIPDDDKVSGKLRSMVDAMIVAAPALREMAEKNGRSFETEFADPANSKLAARTYTQHHRSSVNTDYLEQE